MPNNNLNISRVTRSKEDAAAAYDKMSKWYDLMTGRFEKKYTDAGLEKLKARPGEHILEIGFGTGHSILTLARSVGDSGKIYGIDISEEMCKLSRSRIEKAGMSDRVSLTRGDAARLPFDPAVFDAVFISFTLELFDTPEIPVVLSECRRVLKDSGRIGVVSLSKQKKTSVRIYEWFHKVMPGVVDCRPIYLQRSLEDAGFQLRDVSEISMWGLPVDVVLAEKKQT